MSALNYTINIPNEEQVTHVPEQNPQSNLICRKCKNKFNDLDTLKKHLVADHKTYRPCKKFSSNPSENKCTWNNKCGYSHEVLEPGTWLCWDCGKTFQIKNGLMIHRKQSHDVPTCTKHNTDMGCDKPDEECWYPHKVKQKITSPKPQHINQNNKPASYAKAVAPQQDFPTVSQNSNKPKKTEADAPTQAEKMVIETMNMIKEQNKTMMEIMLTMMQQNQALFQMSPQVAQSQ